MIRIKHFAGIAIFIATLSCHVNVIRADGLQGEFLNTHYWRDLLSRHSPLTNPAFLTQENYCTIRAAEALVMQSFSLTELGLTMPVGLYESWGFSYFGQGAGKIRNAVTDIAGDSIREIGGSLSDAKHVFMVSYANNPWGRLSIGANAAFSFENNFNPNGLFGKENVWSMALDLGLSYRLPSTPVIGEHLLGLSAQNILSPFNFGRQSYANSFKLSWLGQYWERRLESGLEIDSKNVYGALFRDKAPSHIEYTYAARLGGWIQRIFNVYGQIGSDYVGMAAGVNVPQYNHGKDLAFLYQFISKTDIAADQIHSMYVRVELGLHREEAYARRMARYLEVGANDLYVKACKLYHEGNYWDAFFLFGRIQVEHPAFFKSDYCAFYRAACLEGLDMREAAEETYRKATQDYPKSAAMPQIDLGLMRIYYRNEQTQPVADQFRLLDKPEIADSLRYHAYYLMAESFFKFKQYQQAAELFAKIPPTHEDYLFAQHSLAIADIMLDDAGNAELALNNCVQTTAATPAQKEIANRSIVLLGNMFFERGEMSKTVSALREVPKSSYYYEDAVLGLGWAAVKSKQWNDCITYGQELQKQSGQPSLQCDGALIEAYGHFQLKNYKQANAVLLDASEKGRQLTPPSADSLESNRARYKQVRKEYGTLASAATLVSIDMQTSKIINRIDSLHVQQQAMKKILDGLVAFEDAFGRQSFFARNIETIRNDIDYMLAISQKTLMQAPSTEEQKKAETKAKEIDEKIDKLKEEMKELNSKSESPQTTPE
jgi:tetratricopeptide (TPR) repeat protein